MGLEETDYPVYKVLNQSVIKPAIKEINDLTDYHVEVEQKRLVRRIAELKFRITQTVKPVAIQDSIYPDIENLPPVAIELVQAGVDRKMALNIARGEWGFVVPAKVPSPGSYSDFAEYVSEKIEMSVSAMDVKNRGGFIVEALRENYEDPELEKQRLLRAENAKQKALEDLATEFRAKRDNILRQAIHAEPDLVERAAKHIHSYIVRERLLEHDSALAAYQKGGMVTAEINAILAAEFCHERLAPVVEAYEHEKARILGDIS